MQVERLRAGGAARLRAVRLRALRDAPYAFDSPLAEEEGFGDDFWQMRASESEAATESVVFLAGAGGEDVGMAGAFRSDPRTATLWGMWVDPAARGGGAGRMLLAAVVEWAGERGFEQLTLTVTVGERSRRAAALYESFGFRHAGAGEGLRSDPTASTATMALALRPGDG